jgi:hypothetical protein
MVVQVCEQLSVFGESLLEPRAIVSFERRIPTGLAWARPALWYRGKYRHFPRSANRR